MKKASMMVGLLPVAAIGVILSSQAQDGGHAQYVSPWRTPWTYDGAAHWSDLDPEYAACNGKEQSPIDIRSAEKAELPDLRFESKSTPLRYVINNRYTIRVNHPPGNGNFLLVGDRKYQLTQFHFHRPSEEYIHGKPYEMEAHLMYQTSDGKVAGVTVFMKPGLANPTVQRVWDHMPKAEGQEEVAGVDINPGELLPNHRAYFMYTGSLTAPPCTEGVTWFVLKTPINLSAEQMDAFAKLYPNDARPLQSLNGRIVKESR
ncbi:MAG: carbonic anhydrase family protein [Candidatus Sulfotelmatobacter sp.]